MPDLPLIVLESPADTAPGILNPPLAALSSARPTLLHSGVDVRRVYGLHLTSVIFPLTVGVTLFGWRAAIVVAMTCLSTMVGVLLWRRVGRRGAQLSITHCTWLAALLALMLPAHLCAIRPFDDFPSQLWAIPMGAGLVLSILCWLLGGLGAGRVHPVLVAYLLLVIFFDSTLLPTRILQRSTLLTGNVIASPPLDVASSSEPWYRADASPGHDAIRTEPASQKLWSFTTGTLKPDRNLISLEGLLRDRMPPLEDLLVAGHPGPIGTASAVGVVIGGLFLLYRGLIDYRIPVLIIASTAVALLILPVPVLIRGDTPQWQWMVARDPAVDLATAITFVNYEVLASPLLFMAFYLATATSVRPMTRRGRTLYAIMVGVVSAGAQLYASVTFGPYLALLIVSLITPTLDKLFGAQPLV